MIFFPLHLVHVIFDFMAVISFMDISSGVCCLEIVYKSYFRIVGFNNTFFLLPVVFRIFVTKRLDLQSKNNSFSGNVNIIDTENKIDFRNLDFIFDNKGFYL
jgi:hypothetical protein